MARPYTRPDNPCYECENRTVTCHSDCEEYKHYQEELQKAKTEKETRKRDEYYEYKKQRYKNDRRQRKYYRVER